MRLNTALIFLLISLVSSLAVGCSTTRSPASEYGTEPVLGIPKTVDYNKGKIVDLQEVRQALGMTMSELGFFEKPFNSCTLPREMRTSPKCETKYFTAINFQVVCRDSMGTVESVSESDLVPMTSKNVTWVVGKNRGKTSTDTDGHGNVLSLTSKSIRERTLILKVRNLALGLSAGEVRRIVVPSNWCK